MILGGGFAVAVGHGNRNLLGAAMQPNSGDFYLLNTQSLSIKRFT
jgi:hypothetical protein